MKVLATAAVGLAILAPALVRVIPLTAEQPPAAAPAARAAERMRALQREADDLARQASSLLGDLRKLEVERDLRAEEARKLDGEVDAVGQQMANTSRQIASLELAMEAARPELNARLLEVYKLGRPGYARVLLGVGNLQEMGRAMRMVSALAHQDQRRVADYTASVAQLSAARTSLGEQATHLRGLQADARRAADLAARAAAAREALVRQVDARRDLNAQMRGELEQAEARLQKAMGAPANAASPAEPVLLPLKPFRGELAWPADGRLLSRFGQQRNRLGIRTLQNGIEIEAADGTAVRAVHEGRVSFADIFSGFGQLVIIDHGNLGFSLYGYLGSMKVAKGSAVSAGQVIGTTGRAPAGNSAVYFELRIDGKPVDPLQWLKAKPSTQGPGGPQS